MVKKSVDVSQGVPAQVVQGPVEEYLVKPTFDEDGVQATPAIGFDGKEYGDPVPLSPPVGVPRYDPLDELIRRHIRQAVSELASQNEFESFEEADDFDIEDDPLDALTEYEKVFDPPPRPLQTAAAANTADIKAGEPKGSPAAEANKPAALRDPALGTGVQQSRSAGSNATDATSATDQAVVRSGA